MNTNEQYSSKIELLNNYTLCLERENGSKNKEIQTLHNHLEVVYQENQTLKSIIHQRNMKNARPVQEDFVCQSLQTSIAFDQGIVPCSVVEGCSQTEIETETEIEAEEEARQEAEQEAQECKQQLESEIDSLKQLLSQKDAKIEYYQSQCEQMYDGIVTLEHSLAQKQTEHLANTDKISKLQEMVKSEQKKRCLAENRFQEVSKTIQTFDQESMAVKEQYQSMEFEMEGLITENNQLIERTRELEKEKNNYYHELKRMSRVSFGSENVNVNNSAVKSMPKVKDQRWKQIESNLKRLQLENKAIQSNLQIAR